MENVDNHSQEELIKLLEEQNADAPISVPSDDEDIPDQTPFPEVGEE